MEVTMTHKFFVMASIVVVLALLASTAVAQTIIQKEEGDDEGYISALPPSQIDNSGTSPGPGSTTGQGRPPRVGPNRRVNDAQQGFPTACSAVRKRLRQAAQMGNSWCLAGMMPRVFVDHRLACRVRLPHCLGFRDSATPLMEVRPWSMAAHRR